MAALMPSSTPLEKNMREYALRLSLNLDSSLTREEFAKLCRIGKPKAFAPGSQLAVQDETVNALHLIQTGAVKTYQTHANGNESLLRIHLAGSIIGLSSLSSRRRCDATSVTLTPTQAVRIPINALVELLEQDPGMSMKLIRLLIDRLSDLHFRIGELQTLTVEQRLAYVLLSLSRPDPNEPAIASREPISLTHEELAQMINSRRQTVTSTLTKFSNEGLLVCSNRTVKLLDCIGLEKKLGDCLEKRVPEQA